MLHHAGELAAKSTPNFFRTRGLRGHLLPSAEAAAAVPTTAT